MNYIVVLSDLLVALLSLWVLFRLTGYGGIIGSSLNKVGYGTVIIGFSHLIESAGLNFLNISSDTIEISHRFVFAIGLILIAWGFKNLMQKK